MKSLIEKYCSEDWLKFVDANKKLINRRANEIIFSEGDPVYGIYFIKKGKVKVVSQALDSEDSGRIVRLASTGDLLGHRGFGGDGTYPVSAVTLEPSRLMFLPNDALESLALGNANFTYNLMKFFAEELRHSEERSWKTSATCRVAQAILEMCSKFGFNESGSQKLNFTLSRTDLANYSDVAYETLLRTLNEWRRKGIIDFLGKEMLIKDHKALEAEGICNKITEKVKLKDISV